MRAKPDATRCLTRTVIVSLLGMAISLMPGDARLHAAETASGTPRGTEGTKRVRFGELYVAGMAALLPGGGTLEAPGGTPRVQARNLRSDLLIPSGSLITTGASETARIRLGERSLVRVKPGSAVRIFSLHLELERGELCVQHGKAILPLRIRAASSTLDLERDAAADFFLSGSGNLIATVQAGSLRVPGRKDAVAAGQRIEVKDGVVTTDPPVAALAEWAEYSRLAGIEEYTPRLGLDIGDDDDIRPAQAPQEQGAADPGDTLPDEPVVEPDPASQNAPSDVLQDHDLE